MFSGPVPVFVFSAPSFSASETKSQVSQNESLSRQSEVFYSPCEEEVKRPSFSFSEPVCLFPESAGSEKGTSEESNYILASADTMDTSSEETEEDVDSPIEAPKLRAFKRPQRTYVFSKSSETESVSKKETKHRKKKFVFSTGKSHSDTSDQQSNLKPTSVRDTLSQGAETGIKKAAAVSESAMPQTIVKETSTSDEAFSQTVSKSSFPVRLPPALKGSKKKFVFSKPSDEPSKPSVRSSRRTRTFVFTKPVSPPPVAKEDDKNQHSSSSRPLSVETISTESNKKELFEKEAGTYEEFSQSLAKSRLFCLPSNFS